ncbi:MAG: 2-amino-4-hydroxy-6-hydroxymethyldihydropteridine diphosphokinase [Gammaproteobacteria bacterium]|nr:2-amino-4-hydroxy-6-hydroxymethyldihydropteridine diphosphokinase [Gammaproteobacteria bacterium]
MPRVYVGIGSNIDRETNIRGAVRELTGRYGPLTLSPVYESRALGFEGGDFYNLVAGFNSVETIEQIKEWLLQTESRFGRRRQGNPFCSRTLDLDLLLYGDTVQHDDKVDLPHPDILRYAFVLRPLADIAPKLMHPEVGLTCSEIWKRFNNKQDMQTVDFRFENQG